VEHGGTKLALETLRAALGDATRPCAAPPRQRRRHEGPQAAASLRALFAKEADVEVRSPSCARSAPSGQLMPPARGLGVQQPELLNDAARRRRRSPARP